MKLIVKEELIRKRLLAGLSQDEVAISIGSSGAYLSQIERGVRSPSPKFALKIADYFKCSIDDLFSCYSEKSTIANTEA